jgi:flagellar motor protein MotB
MEKKFLLLLALLVWGTTFAQDEEEEETDTSTNLVTNGDFENTATKTLKNLGQLEDLCEGWSTATKAPADVFAAGIKSVKVSVPENMFGKQGAHSGDCYAGFRAYSKDNKYDRSYLTIQLDQKLTKNQQYCFKFDISLADLSKYAVNHIGVYISDRKMEQPNTGSIGKTPQILHQSNKVMMVTEAWETICGTFTATGVEEYIIIGSFATDSELTIEKVKKSRDVTGSQIFHAYYYIDDVEVKAIDAASQCKCSAADEVEADLIYSKSSVLDDKAPISAIIADTDVFYAFLKSDVNPIAERDLVRLIKILKDNPNVKLEVIGHCDNDEFDEGKINPRYQDLGQIRAERWSTLSLKG